MSKLKILLIHVGRMNNKGTQALLCSDVFEILENFKNAQISVSTNDASGVKKLNLNLTEILTSSIDVPLDIADRFSKNFGFPRLSSRHIVLNAAFLFTMPFQIALLLLSVLMSKIGLKPFYKRKIIQSIKDSNLVISHSDENFKEAASLLPFNPYWTITWWSVLLSRTVDIMVARAFHKSVILFPNSVGPFRTCIGRFLAKLSLNCCDYLLIREPISYSIVTQLGIKSRTILIYDTAIIFPSISFPRDNNIKPILGVSPGVYNNILSKEQFSGYIDSHAKALDNAIEEIGFSVFFLPNYISGFSGDDFEVSKQILDRMSNKSNARIIKTDNIVDYKNVLSQLDMLLSSKMHPGILASTSYVPVLSIAYDQKQTAYFERLGMGDCVINIQTLTANMLYEKIIRTWINKEYLTYSMMYQLPEWQYHLKILIGRILKKYG